MKKGFLKAKLDGNRCDCKGCEGNDRKNAPAHNQCLSWDTLVVWHIQVVSKGTSRVSVLRNNIRMVSAACISIRATFFQADNCQKIGLLNMLPEDIENVSKY